MASFNILSNKNTFIDILFLLTQGESSDRCAFGFRSIQSLPATIITSRMYYARRPSVATIRETIPSLPHFFLEKKTGYAAKINRLIYYVRIICRLPVGRVADIHPTCKRRRIICYLWYSSTYSTSNGYVVRANIPKGKKKS